jgi:hypothetical protein
MDILEVSGHLPRRAEEECECEYKENAPYCPTSPVGTREERCAVTVHEEEQRSERFLFEVAIMIEYVVFDLDGRSQLLSVLAALY